MKKGKWEMFQDAAFYGMWAVRPVGDFSFGSTRLFHFDKKEDAEKFKELAEKSH